MGLSLWDWLVDHSPSERLSWCRHEEDRTQLGFSYLDVVVQCQLKCFRISYQTSNYYPGSRGSHLSPMSHTPVFPTPLIYPRAHAHRVKTSTWCAHRREFMGSFFLVCTAGDCRQQPRCAWSWSTHTSISRGVEQGNPHFQGGCACNAH